MQRYENDVVRAESHCSIKSMHNSCTKNMHDECVDSTLMQIKFQ